MADGDLSRAVEVIKERLYYIVVRAAPPPDRPDAHFFTVDDVLHYWAFFLDYGPLSLGNLYRFCQIVSTKLGDKSLAGKRLYLYSGPHMHRRHNAVYLLAAYSLLFLGRSPEEAMRPFAAISPPLAPWHDASPSVDTFHLTTLDVMRGIARARDCRFFSFESFDIDEYEHYEKVENGDMNWIVEGRFLAFAGPHDVRSHTVEGYHTTAVEDVIPYFKAKGVAAVIRLNKKYYNERRFTAAGIDHHEMYYLDGSNPPEPVLQRFLAVVEGTPGAPPRHPPRTGPGARISSPPPTSPAACRLHRGALQGWPGPHGDVHWGVPHEALPLHRTGGDWLDAGVPPWYRDRTAAAVPGGDPAPHVGGGGRIPPGQATAHAGGHVATGAVASRPAARCRPCRRRSRSRWRAPVTQDGLRHHGWTGQVRAPPRTRPRGLTIALLTSPPIPPHLCACSPASTSALRSTADMLGSLTLSTNTGSGAGGGLSAGVRGTVASPAGRSGTGAVAAAAAAGTAVGRTVSGRTVGPVGSGAASIATMGLEERDSSWTGRDTPSTPLSTDGKGESAGVGGSALAPHTSLLPFVTCRGRLHRRTPFGGGSEWSRRCGSRRSVPQRNGWVCHPRFQPHRHGCAVSSAIAGGRGHRDGRGRSWGGGRHPVDLPRRVRWGGQHAGTCSWRIRRQAWRAQRVAFYGGRRAGVARPRRHFQRVRPHDAHGCGGWWLQHHGRLRHEPGRPAALRQVSVTRHHHRRRSACGRQRRLWYGRGAAAGWQRRGVPHHAQVARVQRVHGGVVHVWGRLPCRRRRVRGRRLTIPLHAPHAHVAAGADRMAGGKWRWL